MTGRALPPATAALMAGCLALAACGSTPEPSDGGPSSFDHRPGPEDFYPVRTALAGASPPGAPDCLRTAGLGFPSERAFLDCRRDLEVYELALALWSRRVADAVAAEAGGRGERALAAFTCKLVGRDPCAPVGYGATLVSQPRPPSCVGDSLPLVLDDGGGVGLENCRYGVARYRDNLAEWARGVSHGARLEAEARLDAAIDRFNCKLLAAPYGGGPCAAPALPVRSALR